MTLLLIIPLTIATISAPPVSGLVMSTQADTTRFAFHEEFVEFRNADVALAGSLLLPESDVTVPGVVFIHGAGRHTRESLRDVAEHFASQGFAALIYDKRGTGQSGGVYESSQPYENLVNDALAGASMLIQHNRIASDRIGLWGLSQGGYISAAAAAQAPAIRFVIVAGASVADGMMTYYRDNLFRRRGLSARLRDIAEKTYLIQQDLGDLRRDGLQLTSLRGRVYPPPHRYLHPAWSDVNQPVLAMWGQLDQNVPVAESIAGLKNSLAHAGNDEWTMLVLPQANHDLKHTDTGEPDRQGRGYVPGALRTMTDWARGVLDAPEQVPRMSQQGNATATGVLRRLGHYERLRWYGNAAVQSVLFVLFSISFLVNTILALTSSSRRLLRRPPVQADRVATCKRALCVCNLLILCAFSVVVISVIDQLRPGCPTVLLYLPLLGTASVATTFVLLIVLARRRGRNRTLARRLYGAFDVLSLLLFVPYLFYWNLVGVHL